MLLRSTSTPILKTYANAAVAAYGCQLSAQEADHGPRFSPSRTVSWCLKRTSSEGELRLFSMAKEKISSKSPKSGMSVCMETASLLSDRSSVALAEVEEVEEEEEEVEEIETLPMGGDLGGVSGNNGGRRGGSGGSDGSSWDSDHGNEENEHMDKYYQSMIRTYPGDGLLLANYAKFLKEVRILRSILV